MKALILAAGLGTRLRPLTNKIPKCLVPIAGKPLLAYHLERLSEFGVNDFLVNLHYLPECVGDFLKSYSLLKAGIKIKTFYEPELLGGAGTLKANQDFFCDDDNFLVVYGDNLTNIDYRKLLNFHLKKNALCTVACYQEELIEQKGAILYDENNRILNFVEKPLKGTVDSKFANAGIYVCNKDVFTYLAKLNETPLDFGHHLFPFLLKNKTAVYAYIMNELLLDVGNVESYNLAQELVKEHF